jgi:hypothetical protein
MMTKKRFRYIVKLLRDRHVADKALKGVLTEALNVMSRDALQTGKPIRPDKDPRTLLDYYILICHRHAPDGKVYDPEDFGLQEYIDNGFKHK